MVLSRRWLVAMGLAAVAWMAAAAGHVRTAKPSTRPYVAAPAGYGGAADKPGSRSGGLPALLPIQSRSPDSLGVGKLLVAKRGLGDPTFAGTVILLVRYDASAGVLGLVLNRRTEVPISQVLDLQSAKDRSDRVYGGGPVELRAVFALYKSAAKVEKAEHIFGRVYLISDKTLFDQTLAARPDPGAFRVYLGYTGWTVPQLRNEVRLGSWFVFPAEDSAVFSSDPDSLWDQMIQKTKLQVASAEPLAGSD